MRIYFTSHARRNVKKFLHCSAFSKKKERERKIHLDMKFSCTLSHAVSKVLRFLSKWPVME